MVKKQTTREAQQLFRSCVVNYQLDETRVRGAVQQVLRQKQRGYSGLLKDFMRLVRLDRAQHTADVQSARQLPPELQSDIQRNLERIYGAGLTTRFTQRPALIAGTRIQVGSDVYDGSIMAGLGALEKMFEPR